MDEVVLERGVEVVPDDESIRTGDGGAGRHIGKLSEPSMIVVAGLVLVTVPVTVCKRAPELSASSDLVS